MSLQKTRLGLLGAGFMAQQAHLPCFAAAPNCEVRAIGSYRPRLAAALAETYGIPRVYADYRSLIDDPDLDAIVCIQPFHNHFHLGKEILAAGKSLFTEKPMVTRLADGQELVALAKRNNLTYGVGFMKRFDPGVQLAREQINVLLGSGELGELRLVDAYCYLGDWLQGACTPTRHDEPAAYPPIERRYPGHVPPRLAPAYDFLLEVYSHNLNLVRYLLPQERLECLGAVTTGDETWALTLVSDQVLVSLRGARSASQGWAEATSFLFERGKVVVCTPAPMNRQAVAAVSVYAHAEKEALSVDKRLHAGIEWAFALQARAFVEAVRGERPFPASGVDCLRDMEIIEHVFRIVRLAGRRATT